VTLPLAPALRLDEPIDRQIARHGSDWAPILRAWRESADGQRLLGAVDARLAAGATIFPADVFRALRCAPLAQLRVLILGQDPYHGAGQAEGLAFSVPAGQRFPPSLRNIFKELQREFGFCPPASGSLLPWTRQGVLLLNTALTVEEGLPASHSKLGWEVLTDNIVAAAAAHPRPKVFMLWGAHAKSKAGLVAASGNGHLVLQANHPSPLSATRAPLPFIGCGHFGRAAAFLASAEPAAGGVDWRLHA
jgi:uracil-DNA glycosylase